MVMIKNVALFIMKVAHPCPREREEGGRWEQPTRFCLVGEPSRLFECRGRERQPAGLPQAMLKHRLKLGTQTDHPAETHRETDRLRDLEQQVERPRRQVDM